MPILQTLKPALELTYYILLSRETKRLKLIFKIGRLQAQIPVAILKHASAKLAEFEGEGYTEDEELFFFSVEPIPVHGHVDDNVTGEEVKKENG